MGLSAIARRIGRVAAITALASVTAFGVGSPSAGAAGLTPAGAAASVPSNPFLTGVSCPTTSMCMIVGGDDDGTLAATWNGQTWRWMAEPPAPEADSDLGAVTCLSATHCIAVGNTDPDGLSGQGVAFGDEWDGATWKAMPPMAGMTFTHAFGLSCVTATFCMAVGGSDHQGQLGNAVAEMWNGTSWTKMTPVIPAGAVRVTFDDVSCSSPSNCLAVGSYKTGPLDEFGLTESWNGSTWTMRGVPRGMIFALAGVSCPRPDLCLADGVAGHRGFRPVAAVWNGRTWRRLTTPKVNGISSLTGVSCTSATRCMTVGGVLAAVWTGGTSLRQLPIPIPSPPSGLPGEAPYSVSCANSSSCLAVGSPIIGGFSFIGGADAAIAWNGKRWHGIRQSKADGLEDVSCVTTSDCLAVGGYLNDSDETAALAQSWGGKSWRLVSPPGLLHAFSGVSCVSRSFCIATRAYGSAIWNGSRWKALKRGKATVGMTVSCTSPRFCAAVDTAGPVGDANTGIAVWNGTRWRDMNAAMPAGAVDGGLLGVSCTTRSFCVAVGWSSPTFSQEPVTALVNVWNGKKWRLATIPVLGQESKLFGISCLRRSGCMAVGGYDDASETAHNLAMRYSGGKWRAITMPGGSNPAELDGVTSVSCSRASNCLAIGTYAGVAEVWNGKTWRLTTPAGPAFGLSCTKPTFCMAAGQTGNVQFTERWNGHTWKHLTEVNP